VVRYKDVRKLLLLGGGNEKSHLCSSFLVFNMHMHTTEFHVMTPCLYVSATFVYK